MPMDRSAKSETSRTIEVTIDDTKLQGEFLQGPHGWFCKELNGVAWPYHLVQQGASGTPTEAASALYELMLDPEMYDLDRDRWYRAASNAAECSIPYSPDVVYGSETAKVIGFYAAPGAMPYGSNLVYARNDLIAEIEAEFGGKVKVTSSVSGNAFYGSIENPTKAIPKGKTALEHGIIEPMKIKGAAMRIAAITWNYPNHIVGKYNADSQESAQTPAGIYTINSSKSGANLYFKPKGKSFEHLGDYPSNDKETWEYQHLSAKESSMKRRANPESFLTQYMSVDPKLFEAIAAEMNNTLVFENPKFYTTVEKDSIAVKEKGKGEIATIRAEMKDGMIQILMQLASGGSQSLTPKANEEIGDLSDQITRAIVKKVNSSMKTSKEFEFAGTVSHATMRSEDLIPAFLDVLEVIPGGEKYAGNIEEIRERAKQPEYFDSEDANIDLDELFTWLDSVAPQGYYFGASEGDGSDFGFWSTEDMEESEEEDKAMEAWETDVEASKKKANHNEQSLDAIAKLISDSEFEAMEQDHAGEDDLDLASDQIKAIKNEFQLSLETIKILDQFENVVHSEVSEWVETHAAAIQGDQESAITELSDPYNVYLTIAGHGAGLWDGRVDHLFKDSGKNDVKDLCKFLESKLSKFEDSTGSGSIPEAIRSDIDAAVAEVLGEDKSASKKKLNLPN